MSPRLLPRSAPCRIAAAVLACAALALARPARAQQAGALDVVVSDAETGTALAGAVVWVDGVARAVSDSTGRAVVAGLAPGMHQLDVEMVGRSAVSPSILVPFGDPLKLEVMLDPAAVALPEVAVSAPAAGSPADASRAHAGRSGEARTLITRGEIERSTATSVSQLLAAYVPAFRGGGGSVGGSLGRGASSVSSGCGPQIFVDDMVVRGSLDVVPLQDVESVEIYAGVIPPQYGGVHSMCGVVVLRTRHG